MNVFKNFLKTNFYKIKNYSKKENNEENPYLTARRVWNENLGSLVTSKQIWQFIAIFSGFIAVISLSGLIMLACRSQFIPYVIAVDNTGNIHSIGFANPTINTNPDIIKATIAEFIENARLITSDISLQSKAIKSVYAHLDPKGPGVIKMNQWYNNPLGSPFERAAKIITNTEILSVLPMSKTTWRVEWKETTYNRDGTMHGNPIKMNASVTINYHKYKTTSSEAQIIANPLSIYVKDFSWSKVIGE